jgi:hypothetical protein
MAIVVASSMVDCGFEPWSGEAKDYKIGSSSFFYKHAALKTKSTRDHDS